MPTLRRILTLPTFFYAQRVRGFTPPAEPHFDAIATTEFRRLLTAAHLYLEYGSGGSTLLAGRLGIETVTVESDRWFARAVVRALPAGSDDRMIPVDIGMTVEWGMPLMKRPTPARLARWLAYPKAPFAHLAGRLPDLVLVDGRFRVACALEVARHAAIQGAATTLCFDDYADRPHYHAIEAVLGAPRMAGRMAIFAIDGSRVVAEKAVAEAARDYR